MKSFLLTLFFVPLFCLSSAISSPAPAGLNITAAKSVEPSPAKKSYYKVISTEQLRFPLPTETPDIKNEEEREFFDWDRYLKEAKSPADARYRQLLKSGHLPYMYSTGEQMTMYQTVADEYKNKCEEIIKRYREKLELRSEKEALQDFNKYVELRMEAINLQARMVGGSWGGSGAKAAWPQGRMMAYIHFYYDLEAMGDSLYFQN